jgi:site-specific DNA-methyltransferase (adenine-specific)
MNEIIQGDCLKVIKNIPDDSVDLIVTSPPYNNWRNQRTQKDKAEYWQRTNIIYGDFEDNLPDEEYQESQKTIINECLRVLKETGTLCYNHKDQIFNFKVTTPLQWILKTKAVYRQRITWNRLGMQAFNPVRFYRVEEDIYILGKNSKFKWNQNCAKYLSIWDIQPSPKNGHPAPFPIEIPRRLILAFTSEGDLVLDPYCGSGTTCLAAKQLNRFYIGIEREEEYVMLANKRIKSLTTLSQCSPVVNKKSELKE